MVTGLTNPELRSLGLEVGLTLPELGRSARKRASRLPDRERARIPHDPKRPLIPSLGHRSPNRDVAKVGEWTARPRRSPTCRSFPDPPDRGSRTSARLTQRAGRLTDRPVRARRIFRATTHRRMAILRILRNPDFSNMPNVPLQRKDEEVFSPV
jgi:hypothetical protein